MRSPGPAGRVRRAARIEAESLQHQMFAERRVRFVRRPHAVGDRSSGSIRAVVSGRRTRRRVSRVSSGSFCHGACRRGEADSGSGNRAQAGSVGRRVRFATGEEGKTGLSKSDRAGWSGRVRTENGVRQEESSPRVAIGRIGGPVFPGEADGRPATAGRRRHRPAGAGEVNGLAGKLRSSSSATRRRKTSRSRRGSRPEARMIRSMCVGIRDDGSFHGKRDRTDFWTVGAVGGGDGRREVQRRRRGRWFERLRSGKMRDVVSGNGARDFLLTPLGPGRRCRLGSKEANPKWRRT